MPATLLKYLLAFIIFISVQVPAICQKMIFNQYEVGEGLVQSQVHRISQDSSGTLWITTSGGISRFDGTTFSNLTKKDGLLNNRAFAATPDKKNNIWISTTGGISILHGKRLKNLNVPRFNKDWLWDMVCDKQNQIWGVARGSLYRISDSLVTQVVTINGIKPQVQSIRTDSKGTLWVSLRNDGLYYFKDKWVKKFDYSLFKGEPIASFFVDQTGKIWIVTSSALFVYDEGGLRPVHPEYFRNITENLYSVFVDHYKNVWIGSSKGAFRISEQAQQHFTAKNGLTDAPIYSLFMDFEKNLWLGTNGYGVFKFSNDELKILDTDFGLVDNVVTSLETDGDKIWIGTGSVVYNLQAGKLQKLKHPWPASQVLLLYRDRSGKVWLATTAGMGYFSGSSFKVVDTSIDVLSLIESDKHGMLIGSRSKLYTYQKGIFKEISQFDEMPISFCQLNTGEVLIGTSNGIHLLSGEKISRPYESLPFAHSPIVSLVKYKGQILVGTSDQGIFLWDMKSGKLSNCTVVDGLVSDVIYSLKEDKYGTLWVGTGRGVNRVNINPSEMTFRVYPGTVATSPAVECNTMAVILHGEEVWFGTTKGIYLYKTKIPDQLVFAPKLHITTTQLIRYVNGNAVVKNLSQDRMSNLGPHENNFSISYKAIYLTDPENVEYQYRLVGLESAYSPLSKNTNVSYTALDPGEYKFEVVAVSPRGIRSNTASFSFYISPPFYDTLPFRLVILSFAGLIFFSIRAYLSKRKRNKKLMLEQIKEEEQQKVRQQTSEDFHDDIGNKLARISTLSDLLSRMTPDKDDATKDIIRKIKLNAAELYEGTKHIIWSISPESDNFYEIVVFIRSYASSLFEDTPIEFNISGLSTDLKEIKLPYQYSRHLTMIFKEALNNVLKHSEASRVELSIRKNANGRVAMTLYDNGQGIRTDVKKYSNGLRNIKTRANRIHGELLIDSTPGKGTTIQIDFSTSGKYGE